MVTYYNKKDLVYFGNYLLSEERKERLQRTTHPLELEQRLSQVSDADFANWLDKEKTKD